MRVASRAFAALAVVSAFGAGTAQAADREPFDRVVSGQGTASVGGRDARVTVLVSVPAGQSARGLTQAALKHQGAKPIDENAFTFTGLHWEALPVVQNLNPAGQVQPTESALKATHSTWSSVNGSTFRITYGGTTSRCPSLVKGCKRGQSFDGFNDVGWKRLGGSTLGVTWSGTSIDEADMAINTSFTWNLGCTQVPGSFDLRTVLLHENGHVAGLGHSSDPNAVMYPSYQTARCSLGSDDRAGLAALY